MTTTLKHITSNKERLISLLFVLYLAASPFKVKSEIGAGAKGKAIIYRQQSFPAVPSDLTRIYYLNDGKTLTPLPFEKGITPVDVFSVAQENRTTEVKLNGPQATTILKNSNPSFYVFVADRMNPPPHLLVRLASKKNSRQFTITTIKGRSGYAPLDEENIRLDYRVLERLRVDVGTGRILFINYMEIHPRQRLEPGEYAIIGDSLADIATFRVN